MHQNSKLRFEKYAKKFVRPGIRVLEIGPDKFASYRNIIADRSITWDTVNLAARGDGATYIATGEYSFPVADNSYDIVLSGQVMEHVRKIWIWMRELTRVCKPGGHVITVVPCSWPYHEAPYDCWRVFPEGMRALYEDAGLSVTLSL